jgi:activator of Hsp90 ATPase-like protein
LLTLTFEEYEGKTKLTLQQTGFESVASRDSHREGYLSTLERLEAYLARSEPKRI